MCKVVWVRRQATFRKEINKIKIKMAYFCTCKNVLSCKWYLHTEIDLWYPITCNSTYTTYLKTVICYCRPIGWISNRPFCSSESRDPFKWQDFFLIGYNCLIKDKNKTITKVSITVILKWNCTQLWLVHPGSAEKSTSYHVTETKNWFKNYSAITSNVVPGHTFGL